MRYHLIAIGGSIMHNLAIDLQDLGHDVTGSDDEIYEPSRSKLQARNLFPSKLGWDQSRISTDIDVIILGKHAKLDNPELIEAQALGLRIMSFPEFITSASKAKKTIAITGSHGKTTTTSMVMYVMKHLGIDFDYLVGAQIEGFDKMVRMSGSDILIVEGDEYPSSTLDNRAKMLHYNADLSVMTGIAWDHVNIYKTYEAYQDIFRTYLKQRKPADLVFFDQTDKDLCELMVKNSFPCTRVGYSALPTDKSGAVVWEGKSYEIKVFGEHNLKNMSSARLICNELGIETHDFLSAIGSFSGAAKRLEVLESSDERTIYKDFAHAPSKAKATAEAVRQKHPKAKIFGILELHTFSSLTMAFIEYYKQTLDSLDEVVVFFDPAAIALKQMPALEAKEVKAAFDHDNLTVIDDAIKLAHLLQNVAYNSFDIYLIMSSGNLGGVSVLEELKKA